MTFKRKQNGWRRTAQGWQFVVDGFHAFDAWNQPRSAGNARALGVDRQPWALVNTKREEVGRFPTLARLKEWVASQNAAKVAPFAVLPRGEKECIVAARHFGAEAEANGSGLSREYREDIACYWQAGAAWSELPAKLRAQAVAAFNEGVQAERRAVGRLR